MIQQKRVPPSSKFITISVSEEGEKWKVNMLYLTFKTRERNVEIYRAGGESMKRFLVITLLLVSFVVVPKETYAQDQWITPLNDRATIYYELHNEYLPMGHLLKGDAIKAQKQQGDYWVIRWGNGVGYVKTSEMKVSTSEFRGVQTTKHNSNTVVYTTKEATVVDNSQGTLRPFATIDPGFRYPVIQSWGSWWMIDVGGRVGYISKTKATFDEGIPVLMYHHILKPEEKKNSPFAQINTTITTVEFEQQMKYLKDNQFTPLTTSDLEKYLNRNQNLPARTVLLTIDDGNISSRIYGYPILKKYGMIADQFIISNRIPSEPRPFDYQKLRFLSHQEMEEMKDVYQYHAHTHGLHNLNLQNKSSFVVKSDAEILADLKLNREALNGTPYFAYPFGQTDHRSARLLKQSGIRLAYTTKTGRTKLGTDPLFVPRLGINPGLSLNQFAERVKLKLPIQAKPPVVEKPQPPVEANQPFPDVYQKDYFYSYVINLKERGVIKGFPDGSFKPYRNVTRGQAAKMLTLALGLKNEETEKVQQFKDVAVTNEYYDAIQLLVQHGGVTGYSDGTFRPHEPLKRSQMAKIIVHLFNLPVSEWQEGTFTDIQASQEFAQFVQTLKDFEITTGVQGQFQPYRTVSRAQLSAFIRRGEAALSVLPPEMLQPEEEVKQPSEQEVKPSESKEQKEEQPSIEEREIVEERAVEIEAEQSLPEEVEQSK